MRKITMFTMRSCPYCKQALRWMDELLEENAAYRAIEIEKIDELLYPKIARKHNYYYVPAFYVGDEKQHEGVASREIIRRVLDSAL